MPQAAAENLPVLPFESILFHTLEPITDVVRDEAGRLAARMLCLPPELADCVVLMFQPCVEGVLVTFLTV